MLMDMHCHTSEGSIDAKASVLEIADKLSRNGFDGCLITDHNSYRGHDAWLASKDSFLNQLPDGKEFFVLRGIEYDTRDAGHILVILPDMYEGRELEIRGMRLDDLHRYVKERGGIMGPAHPYGTGFFALRHTKKGRFDRDICRYFDFVEGLNSCSKEAQNRLNIRFARSSRLPITCGSDVHKLEYAGTARTYLDEKITCNDELIAYIRENKKTRVNLDGAYELYKEPGKLSEDAGIIGYWIWNKALATWGDLRRMVFGK